MRILSRLVRKKGKIEVRGALALGVVVVVPWLWGSPVVRPRPEFHSSVVEAIPSAKIVSLGVASLKIVGVGPSVGVVASKNVSLLGVSVRPSTGLLLELGLRQVLVMDVGLWPSPVGILAVVKPEVWDPNVPVLASYRLCAQLAVLKVPIHPIGSVAAVPVRADHGGPHVSAWGTTSTEALQIQLLASGLAGKIFLGCPHQEMSVWASVHHLA